jgi:hypothetical protein
MSTPRDSTLSIGGSIVVGIEQHTNMTARTAVSCAVDQRLLFRKQSARVVNKSFERNETDVKTVFTFQPQLHPALSSHLHPTRDILFMLRNDAHTPSQPVDWGAMTIGSIVSATDHDEESDQSWTRFIEVSTHIPVIHTPPLEVIEGASAMF